jgi:redox-sensitive bicupin YhaK (pirin superfamily)
MVTIRKASERGHTDHGWLRSWHTFSFADYHDPRHMGFRALRVINDDTVAPGAGFGTHSHRDMEIISYVLAGELEHKDSLGNGRIIRTGEFQYMAAGTGVRHSEFNPSATVPAHFLQIWIAPDRDGATPAYAEKSLAAAAPGRWHFVASKSGRDGSIAINQDADLLLARLQHGDAVTHTVRSDRHAWAHVAEGQITLNGTALGAGDGAALSGEGEVRVAASSAAQVLLFDLN